MVADRENASLASHLIETAYRTPLRATVAYLLGLQFTPTHTYFVQDRARVVGGFKTEQFDHRVWMDNVWHLTSTFIKIHRARSTPRAMPGVSTIPCFTTSSSPSPIVKRATPATPRATATRRPWTSR